jgi:hypothetical protein
MSHCYLNLWLPKPIFQQSPSKSMALCQQDVRACMPLRYHPAWRSLSQPPLCFGNDFLVILKLLSADCIFQRTEKMVVRRSQIRDVRWMRQDSPLKLCDALSGMQTCVWPCIVMVKKHCCHIFMGINPLETLLQSFHIHIRVDRLASGQHVYENHPFTVPRDCRLCAGDQTHCPILVLMVPVALPNGWQCFYPQPCLHRCLLSACEYLWLIHFRPKETQLLLSV